MKRPYRAPSWREWRPGWPCAVWTIHDSIAGNIIPGPVDDGIVVKFSATLETLADAEIPGDEP